MTRDVAAELRARAEKARAEAAREKTPLSDYFYGVRADALDEAASLVESAARADPLQLHAIAQNAYNAALAPRDTTFDPNDAMHEAVDAVIAALEPASTRVREDDEARVEFSRSEIATLAMAADEFRDTGIPDLRDRLNAALRTIGGDKFALEPASTEPAPAIGSRACRCIPEHGHLEDCPVNPSFEPAPAVREEG